MSTKTNGAEAIPVEVVGSSTFGRYEEISNAKTYNMYITTAKEQTWLVNNAGWQRVYELFENNGQGRGIFRSIRGNFMLAVISGQVVRFDANLATTFIGTLGSSAGEVFIDENLNSQICIVDGLFAYIYNWASPPNLTVQALSGGLIPSYVTYHNTFFLFANANATAGNSSWYAYGFSSATTITQVSVQTLQTKPDVPIAVKRLPGQSANVIVFGTAVCEIYTQVAGLQNYRRVNTISVDYGCISVSTIAASEDYVAWIGVNESEEPVMLVYSGQGAQRVSTDGIDYLLRTIKFPQQSTASFRRVDGHLMYQFTFYNPADNITLAYDFTTKMFFHLSDQYLNYHPAVDYAYFNNKTYFVSLNNASLYETSTDFTTYNENLPSQPVQNELLNFTIPRVRILENMRTPDSARFRVNRFVFTIEQGNDPNVTDQAYNWITPIITEDGFTPPAASGPPDYPIITESGQYIVDESSWGGAAQYTAPYIPRVDLSISYDGSYNYSSTYGKGLNPIGRRPNILSWNKLGACNSISLKLFFWGLARFVCNNGILEIKKQ